MNVEERNEIAKQFVEDKLNHVSGFTISDFEDIQNFQQVENILNNLINVKAMGFRGVVATAITGMHLNSEFNPLNNFYSCNPRSIFEQGIFYAFADRIPCGKSDPLNVAKNTNVLDEEWANGKRPQASAQAVVDYLRHLESTAGLEREKIINFFFYKLVEYANSVTAIKIKMPKVQGLPNQLFATKLTRFILEFPESGTTPQLVISTLLKKIYEFSQISVEGGDESVFGTNTTSKKPADIWFEKDGTPTVLFEITVKKIDAKRLDDCLQSLASLSMLDRPVNFICRLPNDISTLNDVENGFLNYKGKIFNFIDISSYILSLSSMLSEQQISEILGELGLFMEKIERPIKTRKGWNSIFS